MFQYQCILFLMATINTFPMFVFVQMQQYVDQAGSRNGNINASLYLENFEGTVLYAMNKYDRLLIKFEKHLTGKINLLVKSVNYSLIHPIEDLCGCDNYEVKHLVFVGNIGESTISISCNGRVNKISMFSSNSSDTLRPYPPNKYIKNPNETSIWMRGDVTYKPADNSPTYYIPRSNLKGCLDYFYLDGENKNIDKEGTNLIPSCTKPFNVSNCNKTGCSSGTLPINIADCFSLMVDEMLCRKARDIPIYTSHNYSYIKRSINTAPVLIIIKWQTLSIKNYCLLEMVYSDGSSMILSSDGTGNVIMESTKNPTHDNRPVIISKIVNKLSNVLSIGFTNNEQNIRMAYGQTIRTFNDGISSQPIIIMFGYSQYSNKCIDFAGYLDFHYNPRQFRRYQKVANAHVDSSNRTIVCFAFVSIPIVIIIVALAIFYRFFKLPVRSTSDQTSSLTNNKQLFDNIINISMPIREDDVYASIHDNY